MLYNKLFAEDYLPSWTGWFLLHSIFPLHNCLLSISPHNFWDPLPFLEHSQNNRMWFFFCLRGTTGTYNSVTGTSLSIYCTTQRFTIPKCLQHTWTTVGTQDQDEPQEHRQLRQDADFLLWGKSGGGVVTFWNRWFAPAVWQSTCTRH